MLTFLLACAAPLPGPTAFPGADAGRLPAPAEGLALELDTVGRYGPGEVVEVTITGAEPGDRLALLGTTTTLEETCPPILGGVCHDLHAAHVIHRGAADADGQLLVDVTVPRVRSDSPLWVQAVYVDGAESQVSPYRSFSVGPWMDPQWVEVRAFLSLDADGSLTLWEGGLENILSLNLHQDGRYCNLQYRIDSIAPADWSADADYAVDFTGLTPLEDDCAFDPRVWPDPYGMLASRITGVALGGPLAFDAYIWAEYYGGDADGLVHGEIRLDGVPEVGIVEGFAIGDDGVPTIIPVYEFLAPDGTITPGEYFVNSYDLLPLF